MTNIMTLIGFSSHIIFLQNESINGHHKNVKFMCADVTSPNLHISEGSVDLMFSNWLLMYLSDKEVSFFFFFCFVEKLKHRKFLGFVISLDNLKIT